MEVGIDSVRNDSTHKHRLWRHYKAHLDLIVNEEGLEIGDGELRLIVHEETEFLVGHVLVEHGEALL